jgi:SAM-dependent methyltransferase
MADRVIAFKGLVVFLGLSICLLRPLVAQTNAAQTDSAQTDSAQTDAAQTDAAPTIESPTVDETSVKPGINEKFVDPNLNVDQWVKRFEVESREIYVSRNRIADACDIQLQDVVADVGAGTGLFTRIFSDRVGEQGWIYAVDISVRFLEHINQEATRNNIQNITSVLCAENSVNLPPGSVDVVFICDTYHHFEFPKSTMTSIHRALKNDGHLIVVDFERIPGKSREWLIGHVRAGKEVFRAEILDAGFTLVDEKKIDGLKENYFLKFRKN